MRTFDEIRFVKVWWKDDTKGKVPNYLAYTILSFFKLKVIYK